MAHLSRRQFMGGTAAAAAVLGHGASILPVGVSRVEGTFEAGEVVNVTNPAGELIGRGVVGYSSDDMLRVRGLKLEVIARFLGEARARGGAGGCRDRLRDALGGH